MALVVLDVSGQQVRVRAGPEAVEQLGRGLARDIEQHVEPAPVRHAHHRMPDAVRRAPADQFIQQDDQRFPALEREACLAGEAGVQDLLQPLGGGQALQDTQLAVRRQAGAGPRRFEPHLPPPALLRVGQVHVLRAERAAVGLLQRGHQFPQFDVLLREVRVGAAELRGHVGVGEPVVGRREFRQPRGGCPPQGVEVGLARTHHPVGRDERLHRHLLAREFHDFRIRRPRGRGLSGQSHEALHDRSVRHVLRVRSIGGGRGPQCVEVVLPLLRDLGRIGQVVLVLVFHIGRIAPVQEGRALVALHAHDTVPRLPSAAAIGRDCSRLPEVGAHAQPRSACSRETPDFTCFQSRNNAPARGRNHGGGWATRGRIQARREPATRAWPRWPSRSASTALHPSPRSPTAPSANRPPGPANPPRNAPAPPATPATSRWPR
jgi:hypothetical protein